MTVTKTCNLAYQLGGNADLLHELAKNADVLELVECRTFANEPVDVAAILGPGWDVRQDLANAARAGSVYAVRRDSGIEILRSHLEELSPGNSEVQTRYARVTVVKDRNRRWRRRRIVIVLHLPLPSTGVQDDAMRALRNIIRRIRGRRLFTPWRVAGDINMALDVFKKAIRAAYVFGKKPMAAARSRGWGRLEESTTGGVEGTDHVVITTRRRWPVPRRK